MPTLFHFAVVSGGSEACLYSEFFLKGRMRTDLHECALHTLLEACKHPISLDNQERRELSNVSKKRRPKKMIREQLMRRDFAGATPLHYAAANDALGTIQLFLHFFPKSDFDHFKLLADTEDESGNTPFDYARKHNATSVLDFYHLTHCRESSCPVRATLVRSSSRHYPARVALLSSFRAIHLEYQDSKPLPTELLRCLELLRVKVKAYKQEVQIYKTKHGLSPILPKKVCKLLDVFPVFDDIDRDMENVGRSSPPTELFSAVPTELISAVYCVDRAMSRICNFLGNIEVPRVSRSPPPTIWDKLVCETLHHLDPKRLDAWSRPRSPGGTLMPRPKR